jgi:hypothetical protein
VDEKGRREVRVKLGRKVGRICEDIGWRPTVGKLSREKIKK